MVLVAIVYGSLCLWVFFLMFIDSHFSEPAPTPIYKAEDQLDIIVAARNEALNLPDLVASIEAGQYPVRLIRVIIVNDHSEDETDAVVAGMKDGETVLEILYLSLEAGQTGKKAALRMALKHSSAEWIYFTDADCQLQPTTLTEMIGAAKHSRLEVVFGSVRYSAGKSQLQRLLLLENLNTMAVTAAFFNFGKGIMANAANMLLSKSQVAMYIQTLSDDHPGGDDVFFAQKTDSRKAMFLVSGKASVVTEAPQGASELLEQRLRWASKTGQYAQRLPKVIAAFVFLISLLQVACLTIALVMPSYSWLFLSFVLFKWVAEFTYQSRWFQVLDVRLLWFQSFALSISYPILVCVVGLASLSGRSFQWKARTYRSTSGKYSTSE